MMRIEVSLTGFTEWLIISAGTVEARNPAAMWRSAARTKWGRCLVGDRHVEQAGERGEFLLLAQNAQALLEQVGLQHRAAGDVQRIVRRSKARQRSTQFRGGGFRQRRKRQAEHLRTICDDLARTTGDRHEPEAARLKNAGSRDHVGGEQQVLDQFHAHDAKLATDALEHSVVAHQRAGVCLRGARGDFGQADLQCDDRLARRDRASRGRREA